MNERVGQFYTRHELPFAEQNSACKETCTTLWQNKIFEVALYPPW